MTTILPKEVIQLMTDIIFNDVDFSKDGVYIPLGTMLAEQAGCCPSQQIIFRRGSPGADVVVFGQEINLNPMICKSDILIKGRRRTLFGNSFTQDDSTKKKVRYALMILPLVLTGRRTRFHRKGS